MLWSTLGVQRNRIAELSVAHRLPTSGSHRVWAEGGLLMSYGTNFIEMFRHGAVLVDKILKGARPADLPVEEPTKFELIINAKTAKALGSRSHHRCSFEPTPSFSSTRARPSTVCVPAIRRPRLPARARRAGL